MIGNDVEIHNLFKFQIEKKKNLYIKNDNALFESRSGLYLMKSQYLIVPQSIYL